MDFFTWSIVGLGAFTVLMTSAVVADWRWGIAKRRRSAWELFAERRGWTYRPPGSWLRSERATVEGVVEHAVVLLDTYEDGSSLRTRARARFAAGAGPRFQVFREGALASIAKMVGAEDVVLGDDPSFDACFVVRCEDEAPTRRVWTHRARRLTYALGRATVESDGAVVTVTFAGHLENRSTLEGIADLAGELASYGARELEPLAELPRAQWIDPAPPWDAPRQASVELGVAGGVVALRVLPAAAGPALQLTMKTERELAPFSLDIEGGRLRQRPPRGLVPAAAVALLATIGDATLTGNERHARLAFPSIPPRATIEAGASLLALVAGARASMGAFR